MTPSKPKSSITVGIGVAPKGRSPLPSGKNPFADLMKSSEGGGDDTGSMAGGKEDVLGQTGAKASQDDAGYIPAGQRCGACQNYTRESKDCSKVEGSFAVGDSCKQFFEAVPGHEVGGDSLGGDNDALAGLMGGAGKSNEAETSPVI